MILLAFSPGSQQCFAVRTYHKPVDEWGLASMCLRRLFQALTASSFYKDFSSPSPSCEPISKHRRSCSAAELYRLPNFSQSPKKRRRTGPGGRWPRRLAQACVPLSAKYRTAHLRFCASKRGTKIALLRRALICVGPRTESAWYLGGAGPQRASLALVERANKALLEARHLRRSPDLNCLPGQIASTGPFLRLRACVATGMTSRCLCTSATTC